MTKSHLFQLIPLVRRPFYQRDEARRERDELARLLLAANGELERIKEQLHATDAEKTVLKASLPKTRIVVRRGDRTWSITPDLFDTFSFRNGDELSVVTTEAATS